MAIPILSGSIAGRYIPSSLKGGKSSLLVKYSDSSYLIATIDGPLFPGFAAMSAHSLPGFPCPSMTSTLSPYITL